jgi:hypothetical protein
VPGQEAPPRLAALEELFSSKKPVDGVIHVVSNGFIELRGEASQSVLVEKGVSTIDDFRAHQLALEIKDLNATCERIRQSIHKHKKPKWMLVAVTKVDLYYSSLQQVAKYYSPEGDSEFVSRLKQLQGQVGTDNFSWDAAPVCSWLDDFRWNRQTAPSVLKPYQRDHYLALFANRLESFCEL